MAEIQRNRNLSWGKNFGILIYRFLLIIKVELFARIDLLRDVKFVSNENVL